MQMYLLYVRIYEAHVLEEVYPVEQDKEDLTVTSVLPL